MKLSERSKWEKIRKLIKRGRIGKYINNSGLSPLAILVTSFAPTELIKEFLEFDPEATVRTDSFGATPLHLACLNGTTAETVKLIIEHDQGRSAKIVDHDHCSVLHHAVEYICLLIEKRMSLPSEGSLSIYSEHSAYLDIVRSLCDCAPEMVIHGTKDNGDTPLDIPQIVLARQECETARQSKRIHEVYMMLRDTSIKVYLERKKRWECDGPFYVDNMKKNCEQSVVPSLESSQSSGQTFV